jgi:hypothetical protein
MTTDWSQLTHAYGPASDLPRLFAGVGDPESADEAWEELWAALCHQGTVYSASFAALPVLAEIAAGRAPGDGGQAIALAGRIVGAEQQTHAPGYVRATYPAAIAELHRLAGERVAARPFAGGEDEFLCWLEDLVAFEGVPVWGENLRREGYPVVCPACASPLEVQVSDCGTGTRRRDPDARIVSARDEGPLLTGVRPAAPGELLPPAARWHGLALAAGQPQAAERLALLFGRTTCPDCAADFPVAERIEAEASRR